MKEIQLTQNQVAQVDDDDYDHLIKFKWRAFKDGQTFYATTNTFRDGKKTSISMHRFILKAQRGVFVDHKDGNGLNNQRSNLRYCTIRQNNANRASRNGSTSKYKGVCKIVTKNGYNKDKTYIYWHAAIQVAGCTKSLGYFKTEAEAAKKYNEAAIIQYGEFARLNIIE